MMIRLTAGVMCLATAASAQDVGVVTDIPPVQAMVAAVLGTEPDVIVPMGASPHDFALAPSQARALANADLVVWTGPTLSPWLEDPVETLASEASMIALLSVPGWQALEMRATGHDHGDDDHDDHDHGDDDDQDDHDHGEDHDHEHDDHDHAAGGVDPHAWLDPVVLAIWAGAVAEELGEIDPDNAATYAANADAYAASLDALVMAAPELAGVSGIILPHDGFQYLEARYGFDPVGYVTDGHDADPGPAHLAELRDMVVRGDVTCILQNVGPTPGWFGAITEGMDLPTGQIDPMQPIETILATVTQTCVR